jgi:CDP-diglyceride synthetase
LGATTVNTNLLIGLEEKKMNQRKLTEETRGNIFENPQIATDKFGMPETLALTQFLKLILMVQVIVMFVLVAAASEKGRSGDAAVLFVINGGLTLVKAAFIFGVIRALNKGSKIACYIVLAGAVVGIVYVLATFEPDRSMRYLGLKEFQYVLNVVNLALASAGAFLAVRTLRNLKALGL